MNYKSTVELTFPDGLKRPFSMGVSGMEIAKSISKSLSKEAVAIEVNGVELDLCDKIIKDSNINILTTSSEKGLEIMRRLKEELL